MALYWRARSRQRSYSSTAYLIVVSLLLSNFAWAGDPCGMGKLAGKKEVTPIEEVLDDHLRDGQRMGEINAIKDNDARLQAKAEYYTPPVGRFKRLLAGAGLAVSSLLGVSLVQKFLEAPDPLTFIAATAAAFVGFIGADLANREFHFGLDNTFYYSKSWLFGKFLREQARDARIHHEDPQACLKSPFLAQISAVMPAAIPFWLASLANLKYGWASGGVEAATGLPVGAALDITLGSMLGTFALWSSYSLWAHQQAHNKQPTRFWKLLQRLHIALPMKEHMNHHTPPYNTHYSVLSGLVDIGRDHTYWDKRMRKIYETKGVMPGTWIQDPRAIPADIREKLVKDYETNWQKIPHELWAYAPKAYPKRVPPELVEPLKFVQEKWRADFITRRNRAFAELASEKGLEEAQKQFEAEQKAYPWIYGPVVHKIDPSL